MSRHKVRFYFAYNSPYAFLANSRLERALTNVDVEVEYKPVYSPRSPGSPGPDPRKLRYLFEDVGRFAELYGLKLNPGPMADTRKACLGFLYARDCGRGKAYHDAVYRARFLDAARESFVGRTGRDIHAVEDLVQGPEAVLASLPPEPNGFEWTLDPESGRIVSSFYRHRYEGQIHPTDRKRREAWRVAREGQQRANP